MKPDTFIYTFTYKTVPMEGLFIWQTYKKQHRFSYGKIPRQWIEKLPTLCEGNCHGTE